MRNEIKQLSRFVVGTEGNVSQRDGNGFVIKTSGSSLKSMSFVRCDIGGLALPGETGRPSMETDFHSWIYKYSDYKVIAHTHPTNVMKILCTNFVEEFSKARLFPDQVVFNGVEACVVPYATPGKSLTEAMRSAAFKLASDEDGNYGDLPSLFLLKNHGIVCCADSLRQTVIMTEICDKAAEIFMGAKLLGGPTPLTSDQVDEIRLHTGEIYRRSIS